MAVNVPNTFTFSLQNVYDSVKSHAAATEGNLNSAVAYSEPTYYDPTYSSEIGMRKFRNYIPLTATTTTTTTTGPPVGAMVGIASSTQYLHLTNDGGVTWTLKSSNKYYNEVEMSRNGYMIAAVNNDYLQTSNTTGTTWVSRPSLDTQDWQCCAISNSGQYQYAATTTAEGSDGLLYISTNYGVSFTGSLYPGRYWFRMDCDGTGQYILGGQYATLYLSTNYGSTWSADLRTTIDTNVTNFIDISLNSTGSYMAVLGYTGTAYNLYISTNYGSSWTLKYTTSVTLNCVDMSDTGQYITVAGPYIFRSTDYGNTWSSAVHYLITEFSSISVSALGNVQAVGTKASDQIHVSYNYGATWARQTSSNRVWTSIDMK